MRFSERDGTLVDLAPGAAGYPAPKGWYDTKIGSLYVQVNEPEADDESVMWSWRLLAWEAYFMAPHWTERLRGIALTETMARLQAKLAASNFERAREVLK